MNTYRAYDFIVIGGGPGGIGAAVEASHFGIENILMIEKGENHSQTIRKYYKDGKRVDKDYKGMVVELNGNVDFKDGDKDSTLNYFDKLLDDEKIDVIFNSEVENVVKDGDIFKVTTSNAGFIAKNVIVAIGRMGKPNKPDYKLPASLSNKINFNLDKCSQNENILIVGGGNSAAEYAIALSTNNKVTLNYRKSSFTRLNEINEKTLYECAKNETVSLLLGKDIVQIDNEDGDVKVIFNDNSSNTYDRVVYAIGGTTPVDFLKKCNIALDKEGLPIFDENFETSIKNLFICGDLATASGGSIAIALNHAYQILKYIKSQN
ncbi:MAG: NAD(P)-binding domain-containing protein [Campylobacteraceae bacterium]|jgi:thioredoxin reductase (NADPH)|nr:NAD(P)-binding domain-containing protein [Campylobacteraceae bacterium]